MWQNVPPGMLEIGMDGSKARHGPIEIAMQDPASVAGRKLRKSAEDAEDASLLCQVCAAPVASYLVCTASLLLPGLRPLGVILPAFAGLNALSSSSHFSSLPTLVPIDNKPYPIYLDTSNNHDHRNHRSNLHKRRKRPGSRVNGISLIW